MIDTNNNTTDRTGVIAQRAYELYQLRGGHPGREFDDWLEAEREVLSASTPDAETQPTEESAAPAKPARKRAKSPAATSTTTRKKKKTEE